MEPTAREIARAFDCNADGRSQEFQMGVVIIAMALRERTWTGSREDAEILAADTGYMPRRVELKLQKCKQNGIITEDGKLDIEFVFHAEDPLQASIAWCLDSMRALGKIKRVPDENPDGLMPEAMKWYPT